MTTAEKVAYLKGLTDATEFESKDKKKLFSTLMNVLQSLADDVEANTENIDNIDSHLNEVDEDLGMVESIIYGEEDEDDDEGFHEGADYAFRDDDFDDSSDSEDDFDFSSDEDDDDLESDDDDDDDGDSDNEEMYEIECPACHETIYLQESVILEGGVDCPNCGEPLEFDVEFEDED